MTLSSGTHIGAYEVLGPIGAGGMGEVYRARDTKLHRDVALKVLPELFARDADRLARFEREAHLLAALNHPNIASIYGVEDDAGVHALVMELVPGRTLDEILSRDAAAEGRPQDGSGAARRRLAVPDALAIARQVADALDAAHEQGIIHRDLKPANVKVTEDGRVKVLDFGLAKTLRPASGAGPHDRALEMATMTSPAMTEMGMILGTAAYMSPEQAKGRATDRRADAWAFGAMLYEMLAGRRPFAGDDTSEMIASLLRDEPDWTALPADTPVPVRRLLRRCLEKDPARRLRSLADAGLDLDEPDSSMSAPTIVVPPRTRSSAGAIAGALVAGALVAVGTLAWLTPAFRTAPAADSRRLSIVVPPTLALGTDAAQASLSPDGRFVAFSATEGNSPDTTIWVRPIGSTVPRQLPGSARGLLPFWSPDSREIAFFAGDRLVKTLADGTGAVQQICPAPDGRGGTWNASGTIVFAPTNAGALERVSASGGDPQPVTTLDAAHGETGERFPYFLPDGRHFLFVELPAQAGAFPISIGSIDSTARTRLRTAGGAAIYAAPGDLLFSWRGQLMAQGFDASHLALSGDPISIGSAPETTQFSAGPGASASTTGMLLYPEASLGATRLAWFDMTGKETGAIPSPPGFCSSLTLSPDGTRLALLNQAAPGESDLWVIDLVRGGMTRLTSGPGRSADPVWSPDGHRLVFASDRDGLTDFYETPADGSGTPSLIYASKDLFKDLRAWSPDGRFLVFEILDQKTKRDLWLLPMTGERTPQPYRRSPFNETQPVISPDGRWIAYISDETGRNEVYVESFPTPGTRYAVTSAGEKGFAWRRDGRQVLSATLDNVLFTMDVLPGPGFALGPARTLFKLPSTFVSGDIASDFQRGVAALQLNEQAPISLTVLVDWSAAIRK